MLRLIVSLVLLCPLTTVLSPDAAARDEHQPLKPQQPIIVSACRPAMSPPQQDSSAISADMDFLLQGEYLGATYTARLGHELAGLQVAALGNGEFRGVQYRGGLPGNDWNGVDTIELAGQRWGDCVRLEAHGRLGTYTIIVYHGQAELRNAAWQLVGWLEKVDRISPTLGAAAPPGAIVLFNGTGVDEFDAGEIVEDGLLLAGPTTKRKFHDFRMHVEFRTPYMPTARGQGRGNSGCYLQKRYEVQILDSFSLSGEANECGGLYRQRPPDVNMALPPLTWQTYDIDFTAARFDDAGKKIKNARITVLHNGVAVHHDVELPSKTGAGDAEGPTPGPIRFQWHGNPVHFRNLWIVDRGHS